MSLYRSNTLLSGIISTPLNLFFTEGTDLYGRAIRLNPSLADSFTR